MLGGVTATKYQKDFLITLVGAFKVQHMAGKKPPEDPDEFWEFVTSTMENRCRSSDRETTRACAKQWRTLRQEGKRYYSNDAGLVYANEGAEDGEKAKRPTPIQNPMRARKRYRRDVSPSPYGY